MTRPAGQPTFVLGAGSHKGGTSWLYHYLRGMPGFVEGPRKEMHAFPEGLSPGTRRKRFREGEHILGRLAAGEEISPYRIRALLNIAMTADPRIYLDTYAAMLRRPDTTLSADITPAYCTLPWWRLREIRKGLRERGVRPVSVFLMRDPVARVWSHLRMEIDRSTASWEGRDHVDLLREKYKTQRYRKRTHYDRTIRALDGTFGDAAWYGFYETLFQAGTIRELCDFLQVPFVDPPLSERRNASKAGGDLTVPEDLAVEIAKYFSEVYRFVAERFSEINLIDFWPSAKHVL